MGNGIVNNRIDKEKEKCRNIFKINSEILEDWIYLYIFLFLYIYIYIYIYILTVNSIEFDSLGNTCLGLKNSPLLFLSDLDWQSVLKTIKII